MYKIMMHPSPFQNILEQIKISFVFLQEFLLLICLPLPP